MKRAHLARAAIGIAQEMGWSLPDIAEQVGVVPSTIKMWRHLQANPAPKKLNRLWAVAWLAVAEKFDRILELSLGDEVSPLHQFVGQEIVMPRILRSVEIFRTTFPERTDVLLDRDAGSLAPSPSGIADSFSAFVEDLSGGDIADPGLSFTIEKREEIGEVLASYFESAEASTPELINRRRVRDIRSISKRINHILPVADVIAEEFIENGRSPLEYQEEVAKAIENLPPAPPIVPPKGGSTIE